MATDETSEADRNKRREHMEHEGIPQRSHKEYSEAPNQLQAGEVRADKRKCRSVRESGGNMSERARELRELMGCHGM